MLLWKQQACNYMYYLTHNLRYICSLIHYLWIAFQQRTIILCKNHSELTSIHCINKHLFPCGQVVFQSREVEYFLHVLHIIQHRVYDLNTELFTINRVCRKTNFGDISIQIGTNLVLTDAFCSFKYFVCYIFWSWTYNKNFLKNRISLK